jgi:hypothetical protein
LNREQEKGQDSSMARSPMSTVDILAILRETPSRLGALTSGATEAQLTAPPEPGVVDGAVLLLLEEASWPTAETAVPRSTGTSPAGTDATGCSMVAPVSSLSTASPIGSWPGWYCT